MLNCNTRNIIKLLNQGSAGTVSVEPTYFCKQDIIQSNLWVLIIS